jgi:putative Ca2+/H+ antiporter (TMEM165/GDT1 family)
VLNWSARNAVDDEVLRGIVLANLIMDVVGFIVTLLGQLARVANALGWSSVALYLLFGLGFAYFQFMKR